ncbi:hypothetical protein JOB18_017372 [Solea senegalensis]|uniref:Uncharacterized protein n=1 Tax=Solea senegalensis TaxID=28829 RepID=A0AAV6Q2B8_SOLSE|nr:hypothetical protein JOB18_017372 [Solea senegalensis]
MAINVTVWQSDTQSLLLAMYDMLMKRICQAVSLLSLVGLLCSNVSFNPLNEERTLSPAGGTEERPHQAQTRDNESGVALALDRDGEHQAGTLSAEQETLIFTQFKLHLLSQ